MYKNHTFPLALRHTYSDKGELSYRIISDLNKFCMYCLVEREEGSSMNPLAALIAPLAGLALLGAASAVAVNPILLQLVTINKDKNGRRRRRKRESAAVDFENDVGE